MTATAGRPQGGVFTTGSILRHVVVMTATGSIGLMAVFLVDVINLFYISLLGHQELAAAVGYAGTLLFFIMSVSIGLSIGVTAIVARTMGAGDKEKARRQATSGVAISFIFLAILTAIVLPFQHELLALLGADGETLEIANGFLLIVMIGNPLLTMAMSLSGVLRAAGDARRAMYITLSGAIATALLDPIFIFVLDLGVTGAAIVTLISRVVMTVIGLHGAIRIYNLIGWPSLAAMKVDGGPMMKIALPAIVTQLATPVGNAYVTTAMAGFGVEAVAAWAVIGRLFPMVFAGIFALSGSVGAIFGQNLGAKKYDRVLGTLIDSLKFTLIYVAVIWAVLLLTNGYIAQAFQAKGETAALIQYFCIVVAPTFVFTGALFVANAAFNNLGYPTYSTVFNWARSTLGVIPFCWLGAHVMGAEGVLLGWGVGGVLFGLAAMVVARREILKIPARDLAARPA